MTMFKVFSLYVHGAGGARDLESLQADPLSAALEGDRFEPCARGQAASIGWHPVPGWEQLAHQVGGWVVWRCRMQERVVPPKALAEACDERLQEIERDEGTPVRGPRRREIKDEVRMRLLVKAPTQSNYLWMAWCEARRLFAVEGSSVARQEAALSLLRGTLGSLPVQPVAFSRPADGTLTAWVRSANLPDNVGLGERCVLVHPMDTGNKITFVGQQLDEDDVIAAMDRGMRVTQLQLEVDVGAEVPLQFVVTDACRFRRFHAPMAETPEGDNGDPVAELDADLLVRTVMIERAVDVLIAGMGSLITA